jgi:hypothetical protein
VKNSFMLALGQPDDAGKLPRRQASGRRRWRENGSWTSDLPEKGGAMPARSRGHYRLAFTMMADSAFRN